MRPAADARVWRAHVEPGQGGRLVSRCHVMSCHVTSCHVLPWSSQMMSVMLAITEIGSYQFRGDYIIMSNAKHRKG